MIQLKALFAQFAEVAFQGSEDPLITGITAHSKQVAPGHLFIARRGSERFIEGAVRAGAAAILTEVYAPQFSHITQVIHPDIAQIELELVTTFYDHPSRRLFMVGITGTNGKTTVSYLVQHLLSGPTTRCGLIGTVHWDTGSDPILSTHTTPDLIENHHLLAQMGSKRCDSCVMEVSSHGLEQGRTRGIEFDAALFTNLTQDHLDYHQEMRLYAAAKARLFASLGPGYKQSKKRVVINADDPYAAQMASAASVPALYYGIDHPCDIHGSDLELHPHGVSFVVSYQEQKQRFESNLIGKHNVYNLLGAIGIGLVRGLSLSQMAARLALPLFVPGRLESVVNDQGIHLFVDYAHTEDALCHVLRTLSSIKQRRLICVFGCGGNRDRSKRPKMGAVAKQHADLVVVTSDNPRQEDPHAIIQEILSGMPSLDSVHSCVDRAEAIAFALKSAEPGDLVLIAGKGHEKQQVLASHTIAFDDCSVARMHLAERAKGSLFFS